MSLNPSQRANADLIYTIATDEYGLAPARAREVVAAAYAESGLDPNSTNPSSGAAGFFQLLSSGYRQLAEKLGGLYDPEANTRAILPSYVSYWKRHPNAAPGEAGRDVELSGEPASFYRAPLALLGDVNGNPQKLIDAIAPANATLTDWLRPQVAPDRLEGTDPGLLARVWLLGHKLGQPVTITAAGNRQLNATVDGTPVGQVADQQTLAALGLSGIAGDPSRLYLTAPATPGFDPNRRMIAAVGLAGLSPGIIRKIQELLKSPGIRRAAAGAGGALAGSSTAKKAAVGAGILAVLGIKGSHSVRYAGLWIAGVALALFLLAIGIRRLVGDRPGGGATP